MGCGVETYTHKHKTMIFQVAMTSIEKWVERKASDGPEINWKHQALEKEDGTPLMLMCWDDESA